MSVAEHAGGYQRNPLNFQNLCVNCIELKRNGLRLLQNGYTPNFANRQYKKDYITLFEQIDCESGNKIISLTLSELATGYTLYAFKITDGPIKPGTYGPRSKFGTGSVRLEMWFAAAQNVNIKIILLDQMLVKVKFHHF